MAVWTTISSATSSPRGAVLPATRAAMTNVAVCPATTSTEASVSWGQTPLTNRPRRRSAAMARGARAGHDCLPGDRTQTVLERLRAQLPPEKAQHSDASDQTQQRRAETTDCRTHPG